MSVKRRLNEIATRLRELEQLVHDLLRDTPWEKNKTSPRPKSDSDDKGEATVGKGHFIPAPNFQQSPSDPQKSNKPWYKTIQGWKSAMDFPKVILEMLAIPFAVGYAIITYYQWQDLRHNFEVEQRSWVKVTYLFPDSITTTNDAVVTVREANVGKSPALDVETAAVVEVVKSSSPPSFIFNTNHTMNASTILFFPNDTDDTPVFLTDRPIPKPRKFTDEEVTRLTNGTAYLSVFGWVTYSDQFGQHWTHFCGWHGYADSIYTARECTLSNAVGNGTLRGLPAIHKQQY